MKGRTPSSSCWRRRWTRQGIDDVKKSAEQVGEKVDEVKGGVKEVRRAVEEVDKRVGEEGRRRPGQETSSRAGGAGKRQLKHSRHQLTTDRVYVQIKRGNLKAPNLCAVSPADLGGAMETPATLRHLAT